MTFREYPSIENNYQQKHVDYFLEKLPAIAKARFVMQEKIHGANFRLLFSPSAPVVIGSRNQNLTELGKDHFGLRKVLERHAVDLDKLQRLADEGGRPFTIYGELFGPGIQKEIDYGPDKRIRFFDIWFDGDEAPLPAIKFREAMERFGLGAIAVENIAVLEGLDAALAYDVKFVSAYNPAMQGLCEGVVIKPADTQFVLEEGLFYLKKKNEQYLETRAPEQKPAPAKPADELVALHESFLRFITPQRVASVFSKAGRIGSKADIGKYVKLVSEDAVKDFAKEHDLAGLPDKEKKYICNASKEIAALLMNELKP